MRMAKFIVIVGNPVDGLLYYGPYDNAKIAVDSQMPGDAEWWLAELIDPENTADHDLPRLIPKKPT